MIYTPFTCPLPKKIYCNNKLMHKVFYADTKKGIVKCYRSPLKAHKRKKEAIQKTYRGVVEVIL